MGLVAITAACFARRRLSRTRHVAGPGLRLVHRRVRLPVRPPRRDQALRTARDLRPLRLRRLLGLAVAPTIAYYAETDPQAVWQAGGARRSSSPDSASPATPRAATSRGSPAICFWALLALIVFGLVTIFVNIPNGQLIYAILGLVIFAGFTMFDFQRLRKTQDIRAAPLLAASIFLDVLNVFLLFLQIFGRR